MKYNLYTKRINEALKSYAWEIISQHPNNPKFTKEILVIFASIFVGDEITQGRKQAEINLQNNLERECNMKK